MGKILPSDDEARFWANPQVAAGFGRLQGCLLAPEHSGPQGAPEGPVP